MLKKKCEDRGGWSKLGMYWRCDDTEQGDCPPEFKLEGGPATPRKKPLKGKGWTCFDKKGADVTMCVKADFGEPEDR